MAQHRSLGLHHCVCTEFHSQTCAHSFKPLTAQRSKNISWESESTRRSHTTCLHPMPCPVGGTHIGKVLTLPFLREECAAQRGREHQAARETHREKVGCINHLQSLSPSAWENSNAEQKPMAGLRHTEME